MKTILRVSSFRYLGGHRLYLEFNNGEAGVVDLSSELDGPIFQPLRDPDVFATVSLDGGTIAWPNGADLAPEYLAERLVEQGVARNA
ncbi:MAG: DUF2442 domain-containing protein [Verrucomicrobia bacterium]|nr:DUF2442 domain-containing protein [Verrucomicrobiota bacterium]